MPSFTHGTKAVLTVNAHDISQYCESAGLAFTRDIAGIKAFGASFEEQVLGIISAALKAAGALDPIVDGYIWTAFISNTPVTFEYGPQGSATGMPKYSGSLAITNYNLDSGNDKSKYDINTKLSGTITRGVY